MGAGVRRNSEALGGFSYSQEFVESRVGEILDGYMPGKTADVRAPDHLPPNTGTVINLSAEDYDARITI